MDDNSQLLINEFIEFEINQDDKILKINQINSKGRAIIYKSNIDSWIINMQNFDNSKMESKNMNFKNLTGCITIIDSHFKESSNC